LGFSATSPNGQVSLRLPDLGLATEKVSISGHVNPVDKARTVAAMDGHGEARAAVVRQVRGPGTLVPREDSIQLIPAQTDATVVRIRVLPGTEGDAGHDSDGSGRSEAAAEAAGRATAVEGRAGGLQEHAGHAAEHLMDKKAARRGQLGLHAGSVAGADGQSSYDLGVISRADEYSASRTRRTS
jgi:hypothetical protein